METQEIFRMIRKDLNIKQDDLTSSKFRIGRTTISKIESGTRELTPKQAVVIAARMVEIQKDKNVALDYEITADFLRGICHFNIGEIIKNLENEVNKQSLQELNAALEQTVGKEHKDLLVSTVKVLERDLYKNSNLIILYVQESLKCNLSYDESMDMHLTLSRAYYSQGNFKGIIHLHETFSHEINNCADKEKQIKFFYNIATANFIEKNYDEALQLVEVMNKMKNRGMQGKILNLQANIALEQKDYDLAIKINFKVIKSIKDVTVVANAYSNIAWIYYELKKYKQAKKYIDKAYEFIGQVSIQCSFNILDNRFDICIANKLNEEVRKTFEELLDLFKEFKNITQQNKIFKNMFNYIQYSRNEVLSIISNIKLSNLQMNDSLKINLIEKFRNDSEMINYIL